MDEVRLIDANKVDPGEVFCGSSDFAEDVRNGVGVLLSYQPTIDPETLPIVQQLCEKLARYEQAEQAGRLVIVPDKLFDVLYDDAAPEKSYITEYPTGEACIMFAGDFIPVSEIGETVFRTNEEAEAALNTLKARGKK